MTIANASDTSIQRPPSMGSDKHVSLASLATPSVQVAIAVATAILLSIAETVTVEERITTGALTLCALVIGVIVLRQFQSFPRVTPAHYVIPIFGGSFLLMAVAVGAFSLPAKPTSLVISFFILSGWFYVTEIMRRRSSRPRYLLLPFGPRPDLLSMSEADWLVALPAQETFSFDDGDQQFETIREEALASPYSIYCPPDLDGIVGDVGDDVEPHWREFLNVCTARGTPTYRVVDTIESLSGVVDLGRISSSEIRQRVRTAASSHAKRIVDIVVAILALPAVMFLGLIVALAIKLEDGGPIFHFQSRVGRGGRVFTMVKFRTMRSDHVGGPSTVQNDKRITKVGRMIRRNRIDELPQIFNILRGEMSWIGPRPENVSIARTYEAAIPNYTYRYSVRPGITGWAQVHEGYMDDSVAGGAFKLSYDLFYNINWSLWLDLLIACKTVRVVLTGIGSR